jgi:hypothetical protein
MPAPTRDHARTRSRALEIAALRREGLLFKTIGGRLGISEALAWRQMTWGCPHFWGDLPLTGRPRGGGAPRLSHEPPSPEPPSPESPPSPWWKPDPITLALVRAIRAEMRRDSGRVCFIPPEH